jgi:hypothetical protein
VVTTTLMWSLGLQVGKSQRDYASALIDHQRVCEAIEAAGRRAGQEAVMTIARARRPD